MKRLLLPALLALAIIAPAVAQPSSWSLARRASASVSLKTKGGERPPSRTSLDGVPLQRTCTTMEVDSILRLKYPKLGTLDDFERELHRAIDEKRASGLMSDAVYRIPIIVHVVHNGEAVGVGSNISAAQVASQIAALNEDYRMKDGTPGHNNHPKGADVGIEFYLAQIGPDGHPLPEPGIDRVNGGRAVWAKDDIQDLLKPRTQWDPEKYLNIWTVKFEESSGLLGYAQFPNLANIPGLDPNMGNAKTDGVVINYRAFGRTGAAQAPFDGGRTATHEIGHFLGLRYIWGDGDCSVDDFCDDTPDAGQPNYTCDASINSCPDGDRDMIENYMDYTNDRCMNIFTACQRERMRTVLERSPRRKGLVTSDVGTSGTKPLAHFAATRQFACEGSQITFNDQSTNSPTAWDWTFFVDGEPLAEFTDRNPTLTFTGGGVWDVQLIASNASGSDTLRIDNYIAIISSSMTPLDFGEDFEGGTALPNWITLNPDDDRSWVLSDDASANGDGTASAKMDNYSTDSDPSGTVDGLISAPFDLDASRYAELSFDLAYAEYEDETERLGDTLALFYSTDCGESWVPFWYKGGRELATASPTDASFIPTSGQWRHEKISLGFLNGRSDVHLALINLSNWGNNLYIDNLRVSEEQSSAPRADFYVSSDAVCQGDAVAFSDASDGAPRSWSWSFPGGTPSTSAAQHPRVEYDGAGSYPVTLTVSNPNGTDSETRSGYITVSPRPEVAALASKTSIRAGESVTLSATGASVYFWSNGRDDEWVAGNVVTVAPVVTTTYMVTGFSDAACPGVASVTITVTGGPAAVEIPAHVSMPMTVAPNPASSDIVVAIDLPSVSDVAISIADMTGRVVLTLDDESASGRYERRIDVAELPAGAYAVRIATSRGTAMQRFVKR
jgi:PKD repeat protein